MKLFDNIFMLWIVVVGDIKMETLESCYRSIYNKPECWSYYKKNFSSEIEYPWENEGKAEKFIEEYFKFSGKFGIFNNLLIQDKKNKLKEQYQHIVSAFFLGIKIMDAFGIDTQQRDKFSHMNFLYCWFLACLYHDIGYIFEKNEDPNTVMKIHKGGINALKSEYDLHYMLFDEKLHIKTFYSQYILNTYFKGRAGDQDLPPAIDHGIAGGLLLYDKLRQQFEEWYQCKLPGTSREDFCVKHDGRELHLSTNHFKAYEEAADAIIMHNIWLSTLKKYLKTSNKCEKKYKKISINDDNKLCFILALADTLEPLKKDIKNLQNIYIEQCSNKKGLTIKMKKCIYTDKKHRRYSETINDIKNWIDISVKPIEENDGKIVVFEIFSWTNVLNC